MDRSGQLRNVAFGGAWSEQIAGREAQAAAIATLDTAAAGAAWRDPLSREVMAAVDVLCERHPKGRMLRDAWIVASRFEPAPRRITELARISAQIAAAYGGMQG